MTLEYDSFFVFPRIIGTSYDPTFVDECQKDIVEYGRAQVYSGQNENDKILPSNAFDGGWCLGINYQPPSCTMCGDGREEMPHLARVEEQIRQTCYNSYKILQGLTIEVYCKWMNWTEPKGYAISHIHGSTSQLTGAYFIDIPDNSGDLVFEDVGMEIMPTCGYQDDELITQNNMNTYYQLKPKAGQCAIFHPMLRHRVGTNHSDKVRVSLAFDLRIS